MATFWKQTIVPSLIGTIIFLFGKSRQHTLLLHLHDQGTNVSVSEKVAS